jgi:hypothetical protein
MGRWAQRRRRGSGVPIPGSNPPLTPQDSDWHPVYNADADAVLAIWDGASPARPFFAGQWRLSGGDWAPLNPAGTDTTIGAQLSSDSGVGDNSFDVQVWYCSNNSGDDPGPPSNIQST